MKDKKYYEELLKKYEELKGYEQNMLRESFDYAGWNYYEMGDRIYEEKGYNCRNIDTKGMFYCLRDNSTCLRIEGKICEIIELSEG